MFGNNDNNATTGIPEENTTSEILQSIAAVRQSQVVDPDQLLEEANRLVDAGSYKDAQYVLRDEQIANLGLRTDELRAQREEIRDQQIEVRNTFINDAESALAAANLELQEIAVLFRKLSNDQLWEDSEVEQLSAYTKQASALVDDSWPEFRRDTLKSVLKHRLDPKLPDRPHLFDDEWLRTYHLYLENARQKHPQDDDIGRYYDEIRKARADLAEMPEVTKGRLSRALTGKYVSLIRYYEAKQAEGLEYTYEPIMQGNVAQPETLKVDRSGNEKIHIPSILQELTFEHATFCLQQSTGHFNEVIRYVHEGLSARDWSGVGEQNRQLNPKISLAELRKHIHLGLICLNPNANLPRFRDVTKVEEDSFFDPFYSQQHEQVRNSLTKAFEIALGIVEHLLKIQSGFSEATLDDLYYFYRHYPNIDIVEPYITAQERDCFRSFEDEVDAFDRMDIDLYTNEDLDEHEHELETLRRNIDLAPPSINPTLPASKARIEKIALKVDTRLKEIGAYRALNELADRLRRSLARFVKESDWEQAEKVVLKIQADPTLQKKLQGETKDYTTRAGPSRALALMMEIYPSAVECFPVAFKDDTEYKQRIDQLVVRSQAIKDKWSGISQAGHSNFSGDPVEGFEDWGQGRSIYLLAKSICAYIDAIKISALGSERNNKLQESMQILIGVKDGQAGVWLRSASHVMEYIQGVRVLIQATIDEDNEYQASREESTKFWKEHIAHLIEDKVFEECDYVNAFEALRKADISDQQRNEIRRDLVRQWVSALTNEMTSILDMTDSQ